MAGVHNSLTWSQTDAIAEVLSAKSCHIVRVRSPPDYVEKISRYLESSTGQSKQDTLLNEPPEAESDSGDSLFITQKPVPEAVRSRRRLHYRLKSTPTSPRDLEESGSDISSSFSDGESRTKRKSRRKKYRLPKYSFPFLSERKWKPTSTELPVKQNTCLHNSAMGGFFNCVKEMWQGSQRGDDMESWLPTVDTDGEYISPLSEEERPEDEDIKVVEKKCFVAPIKAKNRHTWWDQLKAGIASHETPPGRRCKMLHKIPANAPKSRASPLSLDTESAVSGESSCRVWDERERNDERMRTNADPFSSQEASKSKRRHPQKNKKVLYQQKDTEDELCDDSDATVCELNMLQRTPQPIGRGGSTTGTTTTTTEPQTDDFHTNLSQSGQTEDEFESQSLLQSLPDLFSDSNNDHVCSEIRIKRRKRDKRDHGSKEKEKGQSQEEPEGLHAAKSVNVGAKETARLSEDNREELAESQTNEGLKFSNNNCMEIVSPDGIIVNQEVRDIPDSKQKKKKRKNFAAGNVTQEVDGIVDVNVRKEDFVFSESCNEENGSKDEKKKKERKRMGDNVKQLESNMTLKPLNDGAEKKKKRKKGEKIVVAEEFEQEKELNYTIDLLPVSTEQLEESRNGLENTAEYEETLEASYGKKHKKKQQSFSNNGEEGVGMSLNDAITLEETTELIKKKKKKKKKKKSMCEEADSFDNHEQNKKFEDGDGNQKTEEDLEDQNAEQATKKKKKKNKVSENSSNISKETVAQSDDSVSARKKEKKRTSSFLLADVKEKDAQTHEEQNCSSQSEAHVCDAEKLSVSTADCEISENLEESSTGIRKKKRKRKMSVEQESVERDHKLNFEATNDTCQSATSETSETGVKRKKKQKRNESELMTPMEELESAAEEPVVLKRKKKKKKCKDQPCHVIQKSPAALATEDSESEKSLVNACTLASPKKKGKHSTLPLVAQSKHTHNTDMSHDSCTSDHATESTLNMVEQASSCSETPGNQTLNGMRQKEKKKKVKTHNSYVLEGTECAEVELQENKKREKKKRNKESSFLSTTSSSPVLNEISLSKPENSEPVKKNKHKKVKRTLHNANEDFLTDLQYEP